MFKILKNKKSNRKRPAGKQAGMTFVELIVVISIFTVISGTVLFNSGKFTSIIKLQNLSQEIALRIVQAQKFASSGRFPNIADVGQNPPQIDWRPSYGVFFKKTMPNEFIFFFDGDNNQSFYDAESGVISLSCGNGESECLEVFTLADGYAISDICSILGVAETCDIPEATIVFTRPNLHPQMFRESHYPVEGEGLEIKIASSYSSTALKTITISPLGQVSIK